MLGGMIKRLTLRGGTTVRSEALSRAIRPITGESASRGLSERLEQRLHLYGTVMYRVDCGGPQVNDVPVWTADTTASPSPYVNAAADGNLTSSTNLAINMTDPSVPPGTPQALFQTERYNVSTNPEMQWAFPVSPGNYTVKLFFAETYSGITAAGQRVFSAAIDGSTVLNKYDVFADVGANKGVVKSFNVNDPASSLTVNFTHVTENPAIKAIEIDKNAVTPGQVDASLQYISFGSTAVGSTAAHALTLSNLAPAGSPAVTVNSLNITGVNAAQFSTTFNNASPVTLQPGQSQTFNVNYLPSASALNAVSATLSINESTTSGAAPTVTIPLSAWQLATNGPSGVSFGKSTLAGVTMSAPTSLQFGPDGKLYVSQQNGLIDVLAISRTAANQYTVTNTQTITLIQSIPNHNDDGSPAPTITGRLVTGILVVGTPANPIIYVSSSDPRVSGNTTNVATNADTNSGIISRLTWNGTAWSKQDLVRGLPRSAVDHATNGMQLNAATNTLYVAQAGMTNMGAPSNNFGEYPEYALSSAILTVNLTAIGSSTYDLPTLVDDTASINSNSPFGGDFGRHQAKEVPGGPVQVYATGFRNPYDLVLASNGLLYAVDNGPNAGWGSTPIFVNGVPTNQPSEPGVTYNDQLQVITAAGQYFGHPNPTRASTTNTFNTNNPQSPVPASDPQEGNYLIPGVQDGALATFGASTDGITQYTASDFNGALKGDLLMTSFANKIYDAKLGANGLTATVSTLFGSVGSGPLNVTTQGDSGQFHGTIWVVDHTSGAIIVYEPADFSGGGQTFSGADDAAIDEDGDGFSNHDEIINGNSPVSAADQPHSWSGAKISDLLNPDDDGDGLPDTRDPFAIDAANGKSTNLPVQYDWYRTDVNYGGLLNMGFTGVMTDLKTNYANLYDAGGLTAGGAAGVLTIDSVGSGNALGALNTQFDAFQFGINVTGTSSPFTMHTEIVAPFVGTTPVASQSLGFYIGNGDQDNYAKLVVTGAGSIQLIEEIGGVASAPITVGTNLTGLNDVDLYMTVDPAAGTLQASFTTTTGSTISAATLVGSPISIPLSWFTAATAPAVGVIATNGGGPTFSATWGFIEVLPVQKEAPFGGVAATIPGVIQAENFDTGGEGVAYHDTTPANLGGAYRTAEGVDIEPTGAGGFDVGYAVPGEWLKYTVNVTTGGNYTFNPVVAALAGDGTFHIEVDGANATGAWAVPSTGGWQTYTTLTSPPIALSAGTHVLRLVMDTNGPLGFVGNFDSIGVTASNVVTSSPFLGAPVALPGTIMADNYDTGGEGVAYHDTTPTNVSGAYRPAEGVDLEAATDSVPPGLTATSPGVGFNVGHIVPTEWMQYTVSVATAGKYDINVRLASGGPFGTFHFSLDGVNVTGAINFPSTGGWQTWQTVTAPGVSFGAGTHVLRIVFDTASSGELGNVEYIQIAPSVLPSETPFLGTPFVIGQTIQADNFNNGGEGVAYHDTDNVNRGGQYRSTGVDIETTADVPGPGQTAASAGAGYDVGYIAAGEWMEYQITVATTGVYSLDMRLASAASGGSLHFSSDGVNVTGAINFPITGGWQTWQTVTVPNVSLTAGTHQLRLAFDTSVAAELGNVAWFRLYTAAATASVIAQPAALIASPAVVTATAPVQPNLFSQKKINPLPVSSAAQLVDSVSAKGKKTN